jgi:hypothetical protein
MEQLLEPSDQCEREYARLRSPCQRGTLGIFREAEVRMEHAFGCRIAKKKRMVRQQGKTATTVKRG